MSSGRQDNPRLQDASIRQGFMVHVMQAYPSIKPCMKGFHLSLETWRGGQNQKGWKEQGGHWGREKEETEEYAEDAEEYNGDDQEDTKLKESTQQTLSAASDLKGPMSGYDSHASVPARFEGTSLFNTE
jgi:hypothetical protein